LVKADQHHLVGAISAYLRSSADKTEWAERGDVVDASYEEWNGSLLKKHQFVNEELKITEKSLSPEECGRLLYVRCAGSSGYLEGRPVPLHFVSGCFNDLADKRLLGWHADYEKLL
jgi:hypothetical protein